MLDLPLLSLMLILPLLGAGIILLINGDEAIVQRNTRMVALWTTIFTFVLTLVAWGQFDVSSAELQLVERYKWIGDDISFHLGVDGISVLFVVLTGFLMPICILASWKSIKTRVKEYMIALLVLETLMIGVFTSLDLFLFYIFFEGGLIPMFLIIGVWGGARRIYASFKFFLYTLLGSVFMLIAVLYMYHVAGTTDIPMLMQYEFAADAQMWLWFGFFASFAVKMPMWPVHTWLPDAHTAAPTAGSVILAGVLLKLGGFGMMRVALPIFPEQFRYFCWNVPIIPILALISIIYGALVCMAQWDLKRLIAYSSVSHMG
ncbi:MAG: NADH-quinone oxidoreductase subunit M, partial [Sphingomonadales bacterium]|nr:NADH-quinone oxidoreductase subunit M [Sphingomonadales bacterium]